MTPFADCRLQKQVYGTSNTIFFPFCFQSWMSDHFRVKNEQKREGEEKKDVQDCTEYFGDIAIDRMNK